MSSPKSAQPVILLRLSCSLPLSLFSKIRFAWVPFVSGGGPPNNRRHNKVFTQLSVMWYSMFLLLYFSFKGEKINKGHKRQPQTVTCSPAMRSFSKSHRRPAAIALGTLRVRGPPTQAAIQPFVSRRGCQTVTAVPASVWKSSRSC